MKTKHLHCIDLNDFSVEKLCEILKKAERIIKNPQYYSHRCDSKVMGTLFYEPSTRTQMSFQTAMLRLGGTIIGFDNPSTSSVSKGENLKDTTKVVSSYADILVIRHPVEGAAKAAAVTADCPVINAGDGGHLHPTQTLTDLLTLKSEIGRLDNLTIGLCGDLLNGRTTHSLCKAMSLFKGNKFVLVSTKNLSLPQYIKNYVLEHGCELKEVSSLSEAMGSLDVLYMTRIQRERFASEEEYEKEKNVYILNNEKLKSAKSDLKILHPLPRVDEIAIEVDDDPRALYFKQAKYGVYVRMALILTLLENEEDEIKLFYESALDNIKCPNKKCITNHEHYLKSSVRAQNEEFVCEYCDTRFKI